MDIEFRTVHNTLVVDIPDCEGKLVPNELDDFISQLYKKLEDSINEVAINMKLKSYLNSSGLGELIKVKDNLMDKSINLVLISPTARVESLINMVGIDQFFNIVASEDELA